MNTILEIILDYSNSMGRFTQNGVSYLLSDGCTRMELAKKALVDDIIPALDYSGKIGIRRFYSTSDKVVILDVFEGDFSKEVVIDKIRALPDPDKTGGTPISAALQNSIDYLKKYPDSDRKIVLVTDGEETDGGDFRIAAESGLKNHGIDYSIFIVGIGQSAETAAKCKKLSESTKGGYVNLETKNYNKLALSNALRPLAFRAISSTISNIQNNNEKTLNPNENIAKEKPEKDSIFKNEMIEVLRGHTISIELLNRQLVNLDKGLKIVNDNAESQRQQAFDAGESIIRLQNAFELRFEQVDQTNQKAFTQLELNLKNIANEVQKINHENIRVQDEDTLAVLHRINATVDQSNANLYTSVKQAFDSLENKIEVLDGKVNKIYDEMAQTFSEIKLINFKTFELLSSHAKEAKYWKAISILSLVVILGLMIYWLSV